MELGITIPLQKYLHVRKPPYGGLSDPLFCWEVHRIVLGTRDALVAANVNNRFFVLAVGLGSHDWARWEEVCVESIAAALHGEGFDKAVIQTYLAIAGPSEITKTHGRKSVAGLNVAIDSALRLVLEVDASQLYQNEVCKRVNRERCRAAGFAEAGRPVDFLEHDFERFGLMRL